MAHNGPGCCLGTPSITPFILTNPISLIYVWLETPGVSFSVGLWKGGIVYYFYLFCTLYFFSPSLLQAEQGAIPEMALRVVCALKEGQTEFEKVKAHSNHEGKAY